MAKIKKDNNELYNKQANTTEEQQDISLVPIEYDDEYKQLCRENRKVL
jgi:hypothetical protein